MRKNYNIVKTIEVDLDEVRIQARNFYEYNDPYDPGPQACIYDLIDTYEQEYGKNSLPMELIHDIDETAIFEYKKFHNKKRSK